MNKSNFSRVENDEKYNVRAGILFQRCFHLLDKKQKTKFAIIKQRFQAKSKLYSIAKGNKQQISNHHPCTKIKMYLV
jgi:hypothetical protein